MLIDRIRNISFFMQPSRMFSMLLILNDLKSYLRSYISVILRLDRGIQKKQLDYPVKPDNDNYWNIVRYKYEQIICPIEHIYKGQKSLPLCCQGL